MKISLIVYSLMEDVDDLSTTSSTSKAAALAYYFIRKTDLFTLHLPHIFSFLIPHLSILISLSRMKYPT
jgi:hypothetical protein